VVIVPPFCVVVVTGGGNGVGVVVAVWAEALMAEIVSVAKAIKKAASKLFFRNMNLFSYLLFMKSFC
jgi:D-arabinose 1-dehydrogenase-like Zn-dependent alcohol dehydrogenase